jgi:short-subunit dehydrogenase
MYANEALKVPKAIIIGASSGMGREVTKRLSEQGYTLGLVARRLPLLESLQKEIPGESFIKPVDVTLPQAREQLQDLIVAMGGLDLIVISISSYLDNRNATANSAADYHPARTWEEKQRYLMVDAIGFIAMADVAIEFFKKQNHGHLVGISSTSGLRGRAYNPEYCAAKACISTYMEGVRNEMLQKNIDVQITDVVPGFVAVEHSPLGEDPTAYWEIPVDQAGEVILQGILNQEKVVYVPRKIWLVAALLKVLPDSIFNNKFSWL